MDYVQVLNDHRYSMDLRYYFQNNNRSRIFTGAEGFYRFTQLSIDSGGYVQNGNMFSYGHASVSKETAGVGILIGVDVALSPSIMLEFYTGIGLRNHSTWQEDIVRLRADGSDTCDCKTRPDNNFIGKTTSIYAPVGVKMTLSLGKISSAMGPRKRYLYSNW